VATILATADQQNATLNSQNVANQKTQEELEILIAAAEQKVWAYQVLKEAVLYGNALSETNLGYYIYAAYLNQLEGLETDAEQSAVLNQTLAQIESLISQHSGEVASYKIQYASSGVHQYSSSVDSQILALKSQKLSEVGLELATLDQRIIDSEGGLKLQNQTLSKTEIRASQSGILHLNPDVEQSTIVPEGTILAQLYPLIEQEKSLKIVTYIPSREISSLAIGDSIRFMTENTSNEKVTLTSTISSIATAAISTDQGNFFRVEAETELSPEDLETVKYGLEGRFIVITGVKTYLQYYIDKVFNNE
jgi:competence factor transport accessory protein ComB